MNGVVANCNIEGWMLIKVILPSLLSIALGGFVAYYFNRKHSINTHNTTIRIERLRHEINALEKIWELLAYMSSAESELNILQWREDKKNGVPKQYFVHFGNLRQFVLKEVNAVFYQHHAGLHLPNDVRKQLFDYQGSLFGLYFKYKDEYNDAKIAENPLILITNQKLIDKLEAAYDDLNAELKKALAVRYQQLLIGAGNA